ncbi:MAG TPA: carboxypeptidase regulatory-like domain-containing protein [Allosphingosinicella sp.]|nr:carboxypeptidase regulatory-like domain-containing protein [Allosphingosinicella sp.]
MNKFTLFCAAAAIVAPASAFAQETTGTIRGDVVAGGTGISNAQVVVTHVPSGSVQRVTTDNNGTFSVSGLRVGGPFTVAVTAPGYEALTITDISITAGTPFRIPVELTQTTDQPQEDIVVTANSLRTRETSNGPITSLNREDIEGVASVTRDIRDIARRDPFANIDASNSRTIEIAGQNGRLNRFSVDGVQFSDDFGLNNGGLPTSRGPVPFDAIEQLSVKIAPFDIEEGDFQGGAINVVLRSGTNRFTGSAFYTFLNEDLTGDKIRGVPVALKFKSEQYGAFLSGPIIKNKLFFTLAYEKLEEGDPIDEGPSGLGFANEIPRVTQTLVDEITQIAGGTRFRYDPMGILTTATEQDEKIVGKLDWNVTDSQRVQLTYIRNVGNQQFPQNNQTSETNPTFGFQSNGYELTEEINSGVFQLNSNWTDALSTELRVSYRDYNRDQTPFGGRAFGQFEICTDRTSVGNLTQCTLANAANGTLASPRIFLGPDISRQSNDLNTENLSADFSLDYQAGKHSFKALVGYSKTDVFNLFLQRSLGDFYFDSITDFQNGRAGRFRLGGTPSGDVNDAAAQFASTTYTFGLQDDIDVSDTLQVTIGARYDLFASTDRPPLNPNFLARYGFSNQETLSGKGVLQPRFGFNYQASDRLILRGGVGIFAGGTPDVFLSNSFSNTGQLTNAIDISRNTTPAGCSPVPAGLSLAQQQAFCAAALNNVNGSTIDPVVLDFLRNNTASFAQAPVNAIDPGFDPPSQMRATLSASYDADLGPLGDGWLLGTDLVYGETQRGITYVDLRSVASGMLPDGRPRYNAFAGQNTTNQDLVLVNDNRGRSYLAVARFEKDWDWGLGLGASYTYSDVKDVNPITSATAGSLYGNAAMADPNAARYGRSIYEIRHSVKASLDYKRNFFGDLQTRLSIFGEYRSGRPFSYTFRDPATGRSPVFGTVGNSSRYLMYVPNGANDPLVSYDSALTQAALNTFIDSTGGLSKYRGRIVPKNTGRSPSVWKVDLHFDQELPVPVLKGAKVKLFADVENVLNLLDSDWGVQRQVNFPYFANLVNVQCLTAPVATGTAPPASGAGSAATAPTQACAQYRYSSFAEPSVLVQNQNRQSLYQIRVGVRFEF